MKPKLNSFFNLLLVIALLLASCNDKDILEKPGGGKPQPPVNNKVVFTLEALPGETGIVANLSALVTIENSQNEAVILNQKLALQFDGKYVSDTLTLAGGDYKVTRFMLVDAANKTRFVTPVANSEMGGQVQKPLAIQFKLPQTTVSKLPMEVLRIGAGAQPEKYGYPAGAFNLPPSEDGETDPNPFMKIKVRPVIKIGDVVYDSIPVQFTLTSWNAAGQPTVTRLNLEAGLSEITLPKAATRYDLQVAKWGTVDELSLQKGDVQEGAVYTLGGSKEAKKLSSEINFKMVNGAWVAEQKISYQYEHNKLKKITYQRKRADNTVFVHSTEDFIYNGNGWVEQIVKKNEASQVMMETSFSYNQGGKIISMQQKEGDKLTTAAVSYIGRPGRTGITGHYDINIRYQYNFKSITGQYNLQFKGGNKVEDDLLFSDGGREIGIYKYNFNINPYVHLNWPDLTFSRSSKHALGGQQNGYDGNYAKNEYPAGTEFVFDADGYPKESITHYMNPFLGTYLYKTKTVYNY